MKKKIVIGVFTALILVTAIAFLILAIDSYNYDMDPKNGVDLLEGFGALMLMFLGGCVVFYECDLFYTVYYLMFRPKTLLKTILNILSNLSLFLIGFLPVFLEVVDFLLKGFFWPGLDGRITTGLAVSYIAFRMIYLLVVAFSYPEEL